MLLSFLFYRFDFFYLPKTIKYMVKIGLIFSLFQEHAWFSWLLEITTTKIFIIFGMNEKNDIMIFNALFIWLHLKLVMEHKPENSLLNIFINYFKSTCDWKVNNSTRTNLLILAVSFYIVIISNVMRIFNFWVLNKSFINVFFKVDFSEKLLV